MPRRPASGGVGVGYGDQGIEGADRVLSANTAYRNWAVIAGLASCIVIAVSACPGGGDAPGGAPQQQPSLAAGGASPAGTIKVVTQPATGARDISPSQPATVAVTDGTIQQ